MDYRQEYHTQLGNMRNYFWRTRHDFSHTLRDTAFETRLIHILHKARDYKGAVERIHKVLEEYRDNKPLSSLTEEGAASLIQRVTKAIREGREVSYPELKYYYCRLRGFTHQDAVRSLGYFKTDKVEEPVYIVTRTGSYRVISYQFITEHDNSFSTVSFEIQGQLALVTIPETMQARVAIFNILSKVWPPVSSTFTKALTDRTVTYTVKCFK